MLREKIRSLIHGEKLKNTSLSERLAAEQEYRERLDGFISYRERVRREQDKRLYEDELSFATLLLRPLITELMKTYPDAREGDIVQDGFTGNFGVQIVDTLEPANTGNLVQKTFRFSIGNLRLHTAVDFFYRNGMGVGNWYYHEARLRKSISVSIYDERYITKTYTFLFKQIEKFRVKFHKAGSYHYGSLKGLD